MDSLTMAKLILKCDLCQENVKGEDANDHLRHHNRNNYAVYQIKSNLSNVQQSFIYSLTSEFDTKREILTQILTNNRIPENLLPKLKLRGDVIELESGIWY